MTAEGATAGAASRSLAETKIDSGAHDACARLDVDKSRTQAGNLRRQRNLAIAKIVVIICGKHRNRVAEGIFAAETNGPSRPCLLCGVGGTEDGGRGPILVALPGGAALHVAEE